MSRASPASPLELPPGPLAVPPPEPQLATHGAPTGEAGIFEAGEIPVVFGEVFENSELLATQAPVYQAPFHAERAVVSIILRLGRPGLTAAT